MQDREPLIAGDRGPARGGERESLVHLLADRRSGPGIHDAELRVAPSVPDAVRRFLAFAGDAVLVAHNARFDMAFLDNETMRLTGKRVHAPVVLRIFGNRPVGAGTVRNCILG